MVRPNAVLRNQAWNSRLRTASATAKRSISSSGRQTRLSISASAPGRDAVDAIGNIAERNQHLGKDECRAERHKAKTRSLARAEPARRTAIHCVSTGRREIRPAEDSPRGRTRSRCIGGIEIAPCPKDICPASDRGRLQHRNRDEETDDREIVGPIRIAEQRRNDDAADHQHNRIEADSR